MNRTDIQRLRDARDFARHAQASVGDHSIESLSRAPPSLHAALYGLVVIGETLNRVSAEVQAPDPDLPWKATRDLRNIIVHAYWQVDVEIISGVVRNRLDPLISRLDALIEFVQRTEQ